MWHDAGNAHNSGDKIDSCAYAVFDKSAPRRSLPLVVTIATRLATITTVHARTGGKLPAKRISATLA